MSYIAPKPAYVPALLHPFPSFSMTFNRTTVIAGMFAGVATALWTLFEFAMGWHGPKIEIGAKTGFVGIVFPLIAIIWALRQTKTECGGVLSLRQALRVGLSISLILSAVGVVFYQIYYTAINPEFLSRMQASGTPADTVIQLVTVVVGSICFSLVVALIGGLVMRSPSSARGA